MAALLVHLAAMARRAVTGAAIPVYGSTAMKLVEVAARGSMRWTGLLFAVAFVTAGIERVDPAAQTRIVGLPPARACRGQPRCWPWLLRAGSGVRVMIRPLRRAHCAYLAGAGGAAARALYGGVAGAAQHHAAQPASALGANSDECHLPGGGLEPPEEDLRRRLAGGVALYLAIFMALGACGSSERHRRDAADPRVSARPRSCCCT